MNSTFARMPTLAEPRLLARGVEGVAQRGTGQNLTGRSGDAAYACAVKKPAC